MHRLAQPALLSACALLLGACGDKGALEDKGAASGTKDDVAQTEAASGSRPSAEDAAALARLADKYVQAVVERDFRRACQTRSRAERRALAEAAGSCAKGLGAEVGRLADVGGAEVRAETIILREDVAEIPVVEPGGTDPIVTLTARREDGRFRLFDETG